MLSHSIGAITSGMPVSGLAEAMFQDALVTFAQESEASAASNVAVFQNAAIRRLIEVHAVCVYCSGVSKEEG